MLFLFLRNLITNLRVLLKKDKWSLVFFLRQQFDHLFQHCPIVLRLWCLFFLRYLFWLLRYFIFDKFFKFINQFSYSTHFYSPLKRSYFFILSLDHDTLLPRPVFSFFFK